jgi:uncharacterized membrane protein
MAEAVAPGRPWSVLEAPKRLAHHARVGLEDLGPPRVLLGSLIALFVLVFGRLVYQRHARFGSFDYDLGLNDQAIWLLAHGHMFDTVRGLDVFGHHVTPAYLLFVPFYWLGAGPHFINLVMVVVLALGAVPVFLLAREWFRNEWHAVVPAVAFLLHFTNQWMLQETFHPEVMAITPFLFAYLAATRERWRAMALWLVLAVAWKEDVALAAMMLGLLLVWRGWRGGHHNQRRVGVATALAGLAWFVICIRLIIPAFSPEGVLYEQLYGDLGNSPVELADTAVTNPTAMTRQLDDANALGYVRDLTAPYGFTPLLSPGPLLIGLPQAVANLLSAQDFTHNLRFHYAAMPVVAATVAMVEGIGRRRRLAVRRFLLGLVAACALATSATWGISPISRHYRAGFWPLSGNERQEELQQAVNTPPGDASVAATYLLVPHLTHRRNVYTFPNPWESQNWGVRGEFAHDPDSVDWLVIDRATLSPEADELLQEILRDGWVLLVAEDDLVVAHREGAAVRG